MKSEEEGNNIDEEEEGGDQLQSEQRKEKKQLQARITALKRSVAKGDKKGKKSIASEIAALELELAEKSREGEKTTSLLGKESREGEKGREGEKTISLLGKESREGEKMTSLLDNGLPLSSVVSDNQTDQGHKVSKAQKRRDKKAQEQRFQSEAALEDENSPETMSAKLESEAIKAHLTSRHLTTYEIEPNGDCLYNAVAHQASLHSNVQYSGADLRKKAANYIRSHCDDFLPFLLTIEGDAIDVDHFDEYCENVEKTSEQGGAWGAEPELRALKPLLIGDYSALPLTVIFRRCKYRLGEHYDSTIPSALIE